MRRALVSAKPARILSRGMASHGAPRPVVPIIASNPSEQIHPVGPFYESILRSSLPSHSSKTQAAPAAPKPAEPAPAPKPAAPEPKQTKPAPEKAPEKAPEPAKQAEKQAEKPAEKPAEKVAEPAEDKSAAAAPEEKKPTTTSSSSSSFSSKAKFARSSIRGGIVFASRLSGAGSSLPADDEYRQSLLRASRSRVVAGVRVPPKPEEPDNCCMSSCVDCVWERYRDEMEEWAAAMAEVERRTRTRKEQGGGSGSGSGGGGGGGGGSGGVQEAEAVSEEVGVTEASVEAVERGKGMKMGVHDEVADREGGTAIEEEERTVEEDAGKGPGGWDEDELYKHVPVGIREFMKHEKKMRERKLQEGGDGGKVEGRP
ncbi:hypothetical protein VTJ83DRAFT_5347 [Remersonia thermophila]|uniref:Oxidoreductase-like domain-containing protein n=1 Tax=Remersonia thermophila TaxID=72144 RepID=A0ABR4D7D3_9PEZI